MTDDVRWVRNEGVDIAYRTIGEGPMDIVFVNGLISHIEVLTEEPGLRRFYDRLGRSGRLILFDRRGSGLSSTPAEDWTLEQEVSDLQAVLDAAGSERVVLFGYAQGGPLALAFAAQRPERTLALVLYAAMVHSRRTAQIEWAMSDEEREAGFNRILERWGTGATIAELAPSVAGDDRMRRWFGRLERSATSPSGVVRIARMLAEFDATPLLEHIRVPALVLHRSGDRVIDPRHSRYAAEHVAGARLIELPGEDNLPMVGDVEGLLGEVEEFLTGGRRGGELERELLTVLFTDVVDATTTAARIGDARWRDMLAAHDAEVRVQLDRFGGTEVKTIGDAFLATFAGPPSQAVRCARAIVDSVGEIGLQLRCGLHTGECEHIGGDIGGMAVHIAARVSALAAAGEVMVSGTVYGTVVGSELRFEDRGSRPLKGVHGMWPLFVLSR